MPLSLAAKQTWFWCSRRHGKPRYPLIEKSVGKWDLFKPMLLVRLQNIPVSLLRKLLSCNSQVIRHVQMRHFHDLSSIGQYNCRSECRNSSISGRVGVERKRKEQLIKLVRFSEWPDPSYSRLQESSNACHQSAKAAKDHRIWYSAFCIDELKFRSNYSPSLPCTDLQKPSVAFLTRMLPT